MQRSTILRALLAVLACALASCASAPSENAGAPATEASTTAGTTPASTPSPDTSASPEPCVGSPDLGQVLTSGPGPVVICLDQFLHTDDAVASSAVRRQGSFASAELALAALLDEEPQADESGWIDAVPRLGADAASMERVDGELRVTFPRSLLDAHELSTSANSAVFLAQLYGTAFSDETVAEAHFTVEGSDVVFCGLLERHADCAHATRAEYESGAVLG